MAKIVALKCPNCNSNVERSTMKCEYCGAELILTPDGNSFSPREQVPCPKCGRLNEKSSIICFQCNAALTKDVEWLKERQKKIRFENNRVKSGTPWIKENIPDDEFIHFLFKKNDDVFFLITEKRLVIYENPTSFEPLVSECLVSDIVSIGDVQNITFKLYTYPTFEVNSYDGSMKFEFESVDLNNAITFWQAVTTAVDNYDNRRKDIRSIIMNLEL